MKIIIVANSPIKSFNHLYHFNPSDYFIGIDGGCQELFKRKIIPDIAIGDFDSTDSLHLIEQKSLETRVYPKEKNETDLELALMHLNEIKGADNLIIQIYDALSGRLDHELVAIRLLRKYAKYNLQLIDEQNMVQYVTADSTIRLESHLQYFSIIPVGETVVTVKNALYPLTKVHLTEKDTYTTSNKPLDDKSEPIIQVHQGSVYVISINTKK